MFLPWTQRLRAIRGAFIFMSHYFDRDPDPGLDPFSGGFYGLYQGEGRTRTLPARLRLSPAPVLLHLCPWPELFMITAHWPSRARCNILYLSEAKGARTTSRTKLLDTSHPGHHIIYRIVCTVVIFCSSSKMLCETMNG